MGMKEMMADIKEIKNDVKGNNTKIDNLSNKVENLETKCQENEDKNANKFKEMKEEIGKVEDKVTSKLLSEIEPSLNGMKNEIQTAVGLDIRRLVQEEMALQKLKEAKEQEAASIIEEDSESNKNNKIQKKN